MAAEQDITDSLFADMNVASTQLNLEKDYVNMGKKVSDVLYNGKAPYRIPAFYKEVLRELPKHLESIKIKEVLDTLTTIYNEKVKEEKEKEKTGGKGKGKAQLKSGKMLQNAKMMDDVMAEDDYGSEKEYDEDEEEEGASASKKKKGGAKKKVEEEEYDFM